MTQYTPDIPSDSSLETPIAPALLKELTVSILVRKGMFEAEAEMVADRLVEADLRGIHSHGTRALPKYISAMDDGDIDPRAMDITLCETPAMAVIEASSGVGHVAATRATQLAIDKAKEVGTGTVVVKKGQHYGAAGVYALMMAQQGMIGFTTTSTGTATVAPYGSREPGIANNAIGWGIPTSTGAPFVLDMAVAEASWGKIETRSLYGLPIPAGWALDEDGKETTDATAAKTLLPAAGARGFGLAFVCAALTSALVGRRTPIHKVQNPFGPGSDHFFYAIDPHHFGEPERFQKEIDSTIADIRNLAAADGFDQVRICGELEWERSERWKTEGIPMLRESLESLRGLCLGVGCTLPEGWPE